MRKLMWRMGRAFDLTILFLLLGFSAAAVVCFLSGHPLFATTFLFLALSTLLILIRLIRSGSFLQPW